MMKRALCSSVLLSLVGLLAACGGLSTPEAEQRCNQERQANGTNCVTEEAYDECVSCYEECGDSCARLESCPVQYQCEE